MPVSNLTDEDLNDLRLIKKIRKAVFSDKNTDVKIYAGKDGKLHATKQKNSNID